MIDRKATLKSSLPLRLSGLGFALGCAVGCSSNGPGANGPTDANAGNSGISGNHASAGMTSAGNPSTTTGGGGSGNAGGGSNTGGDKPSTGGQTPTMPHTAGNCENLKPAGEWEYIWNWPAREGSQAGDATSMAVDPFNAATVWASAFKQGLFKSTDCGSMWTHVNTGKNGDQLDLGSLVSIAIDPIEAGTIFVAPIYGAGGVWKSTNGGVDWEQLFPPDQELGKVVQYNHFDSVTMDPNDHLHVVVGTHAECAAPYGPACHAETTDGGKTWKFVVIPGGGWQEQAGPFVLDAKRWVYAAPGGLWLTKDNGATWTDVNPGAQFGGGEVANHGISRGKDGTYYLSSYSGVASSPDGEKWTIIPNSGGRKVGLDVDGGLIFASDQWSPTYHMASDTDPTKWTEIKGPKDIPMTQGAPYLDYDPTHKILYSANFAGGLWRMVIQ